MKKLLRTLFAALMCAAVVSNSAYALENSWAAARVQTAKKAIKKVYKFLITKRWALRAPLYGAAAATAGLTLYNLRYAAEHFVRSADLGDYSPAAEACERSVVLATLSGLTSAAIYNYVIPAVTPQQKR